MGHLAVFLSHCTQNMPKLPPHVFIAINMFICCCIVIMHLFPLYIPGNRLKPPSEWTMFKWSLALSNTMLTNLFLLGWREVILYVKRLSDFFWGFAFDHVCYRLAGDIEQTLDV